MSHIRGETSFVQVNGRVRRSGQRGHWHLVVGDRDDLIHGFCCAVSSAVNSRHGEGARHQVTSLLHGIVCITGIGTHVGCGKGHSDLTAIIRLYPGHGSSGLNRQVCRGQATVKDRVRGRSKREAWRCSIGHRNGLNGLRNVVTAILCVEGPANGELFGTSRRNHFILESHVHTRVTRINGRGHLEVNHHIFGAGNHRIRWHMCEDRL